MNQKGFTLIEMLVALAAGTVILFSVIGALYMVMHGTPEIRKEAGALEDLERAAHWLTRDVPMGASSNLEDGAPPVSQITITWSDFTRAAEQEESVSHSLSYTWLPGTGELQRNYDGEVTIVGSHLTNVEFSLNDRSVTVTLTSSIDEESRSTITRVYKILMRGEMSS